MESHPGIPIREYVKQGDPDPRYRLAYLWQVSRELHELQNRGDGTQNGPIHVATVEDNGWRLLHTSDLRDGGRILHVDKFTPYQVFLFSCAACCHDFDKALEKYEASSLKQRFVHGVGSADFVKKNFEVLGLTSIEAHDIGAIIAIHDLRGAEFAEALKKLPRELASGKEKIDLYRLALLLKVADILHTDSSRIAKLGVNLRNATDLQRNKHLARSLIRGWIVDGCRIVIQFEQPCTPEKRQAIDGCRTHMVEQEWPAVAMGLQEGGFPHVLEFVEISLRIGGGTGAGESGIVPAANVDLQGTRYLPISVTDAMIGVSVNKSYQYPMCLYEAATHGAGAAVASLAVLAVLDKARYLRDLLNSKSRDLRRENVFSPNKLREHMMALAQVKSFTRYMLFEQDAGPDRKVGVVLNRAFCQLPNGKAILRERMAGVRKSFESRSVALGKLLNEINREINRLPIAKREEARDNEDKWREDIRQALLTCADRLLSLQDTLDEVIGQIQEMRASLNHDWNCDVIELWQQGGTCKPQRPRVL